MKLKALITGFIILGLGGAVLLVDAIDPPSAQANQPVTEEVTSWADKCIDNIGSCENDIIVYQNGRSQMLTNQLLPTSLNSLRAWKAHGSLSRIAAVVTLDDDPVEYQNAARTVAGR